jgi:hypothetical protein
MTNQADTRQDDRRPAGRERADERPLIDSNKPTPGSAEGEEDPAEQSVSSRDEGDPTDRLDDL